jgi:hypothetical protein
VFVTYSNASRTFNVDFVKRTLTLLLPVMAHLIMQPPGRTDLAAVTVIHDYKLLEPDIMPIIGSERYAETMNSLWSAEGKRRFRENAIGMELMSIY